MNKKNLLIPIIAWSLWSCNTDTNKEVQENQSSEPVGTIIRNPISADGSIDTTMMAKISLEEERWTFDTITSGQVIEHTFNFTNSSSTPLLISNVSSSCGCTVPEWSKEAVDPGKSSSIQVRFDSDQRKGFQEKTIIITANTFPTKTKVYLQGYVLENN